MPRGQGKLQVANQIFSRELQPDSRSVLTPSPSAPSSQKRPLPPDLPPGLFLKDSFQEGLYKDRLRRTCVVVLPIIISGANTTPAEVGIQCDGVNCGIFIHNGSFIFPASQLNEAISSALAENITNPKKGLRRHRSASRPFFVRTLDGFDIEVVAFKEAIYLKPPCNFELSSQYNIGPNRGQIARRINVQPTFKITGENLERVQIIDNIWRTP